MTESTLTLFITLFVSLSPFFQDSDSTGIIFRKSDQALGNTRSFSTLIADADLDGDLDLFTAHTSNGKKLSSNTGSGLFTPLGQLLGSARVASVACGKLDKDNDIDLVLGLAENSGGNPIYLNESTTHHQDNRSQVPTLKGPYLGQQPPGMIPEIFPPRMLQADSTWFWHGSPMFSPDLKEMYFIKFIKDQRPPSREMYWMKCDDNKWTLPLSTSLTHSNYRDNNPFFSQSNDTIYYFTARYGGNIVCATRRGEQWSQPAKLTLPLPTVKNLGQQFSIAKNGTIYAELWESNDSDGDIYRWQKVNGKYATAEKLSSSVNSSQYDFAPFIDPAERFLLFCSNRPDGFGKNDLYISYQKSDGTWTKALNLGPNINSAEEEAFPSLSPDGKYFFFCREGRFGFNPYWVDVKVLEEKGSNNTK